MVVCLFVWGFSSHSRIFHSHGDVTIAGEGLQILTYARHSWSLSNESSLACHNYCDMGHPFIMVISEDPRNTHTYCGAFVSGVVTTCFFDSCLSRLGCSSVVWPLSIVNVSGSGSISKNSHVRLISVCHKMFIYDE